MTEARDYRLLFEDGTPISRPMTYEDALAEWSRNDAAAEIVLIRLRKGAHQIKERRLPS